MSDKFQDLQQEFDRLAKEANDASWADSSMRRFLEHPSYLQILEMGAEAIPMILRRMEEGRGHWFHAMMVLTGATPVPDESRGRIQEMNRIWLEWAKGKGYEW